MLGIKRTTRVLLVSLFAVLFIVAGGLKASAASVLTSATDLKGYDATVTTKADGTNILTTKKGEYVLNEQSSLYSSKTITITLNNTVPVDMGAINVKSTLEFKGNGTLNVTTTGETGIYVGAHLRAFKSTKYGKGHVTAIAAGTGLFVHNEIQMEGGTVEAYGKKYGIYCENDIKPYYDAVLKGTASEGIGIYAYRDIYAWKGATVVGEGHVAGARSIIAHIQAEDAGSSITGISTNINSQYSALHADKQMLRAYSGAIVREEYKKPTFKITDDVPVFVTDFTSVARNMKNMKNYKWYSEPDNVFLNSDGGLLGDLSKGSPKQLKIVGYRQDTKVNKNEVTQLKSNGIHEVIFSEAPTDFTVPVTVKYWVNEYSGDDFYLYSEETIDYPIGEVFNYENHLVDFSAYEHTFVEVDVETFVVEKTDSGYVVNYYYKVDFD
ncbi:carbohydrate-binding domain-containing protein [Enterococcus sp. BWB1-3]|uniref:carbohydrate-binding domain-containing protein n=1 Tax=Enterococcus sp. BWB1-3 TaxID=2787713 RepID=UPI001921A32D|nr:carbohydrate-binding domain-containing protein [Enterococcus sp. BWB1-3]MBL1229914.1 carbohydrate-binding domain-containing protein [Enterococcus sp. BWB1-3]